LAVEAVADDSRQQARVVDVGVCEEQVIDACGLVRGLAPVQEPQLLQALEEPGVHLDAA
jgi:hypothetical protein